MLNEFHVRYTIFYDVTSKSHVILNGTFVGFHHLESFLTNSIKEMSA